MTAPSSPSRDAATSESPGSRRTSRPFVGRGRELEELQEALDEAAAERGGVMIVTGDAGIGKTRLLTEVADQAMAHGWTVFAGRCWEEGGAPAYWPWIQVVRAPAETSTRSLRPRRGPQWSRRIREASASRCSTR